MIIYCSVNAIFEKVIETKLDNNYRTYIRKERKNYKNATNQFILYLKKWFDGLMTVYEEG